MKLPKPKYTVTDKNHRYTALYPDGRTVGPLKSCTGVTGQMDKPALVGWAAKMAAEHFKTELLRMGAGALTPAILEAIAYDAKMAHRKKATAAADLGTACHELFEAIIAGKEPASVPPELVEPMIDFKRWRVASDIELVASELAVASVRMKVGGRIDAVGYSKTRGGFGIVDYKTSSGFYGNEYAWQTVGYAAMLEEQYDVPVKWAEIARFGKAPPYDSEVRPVVDMVAARIVFEHLTGVIHANGVQMIGEPHFTTAGARAVEVAAAPKMRKKISGPQDKQALGF